MEFKKVLTVFALLLTFAAPVFAHGDNMTTDEKVQKLKKELKLNDDQVNKVRPIIDDFKTNLEKLKQEKENKLSRVLNPDQMNKLQELKEKEKKD